MISPPMSFDAEANQPSFPGSATTNAAAHVAARSEPVYQAFEQEHRCYRFAVVGRTVRSTRGQSMVNDNAAGLHNFILRDDTRPFCVIARKLFDQSEVFETEQGVMTMPQVFIGGAWIGSNDQMDFLGA